MHRRRPLRTRALIPSFIHDNHVPNMSFDPSKRGFLRASLGTTAALTALSTLPLSIRRALAIEANSVTGTLQDVKHVVLLMLENRSFDSHFGTFRGVRGFGDRHPIPLANGSHVLYQTDANGNTETPYHLDGSKGNAQRAGGTPHTWPDAQAAWDHGRMNRWPVAKQPLSMAYMENAEVPFHRALADAFTLCDAYHCSMHTGTIPNRLFYWTGTNGPSGDNYAAIINQYNGGNDVGPSTEGWTWTTYADRLEKAGVSWKVYQSLDDNFGCNQLMSFRHWREAMEAMPADRRPVALPAISPAYDPAIDDALSPLAKGFGNTMPDGLLQSLRDDVKNGTLPAVSWIIPPSTYSEHPGPSSPAQGGWYMQEVLDALTSNPEVWASTVLLINYDENDGFFDHLPPPSAPSVREDGSLAGKTTLSDEEMAFEYHNYAPASSSHPAQDGKPFGPGPRVPMWVVSPWSRGGWVNSQVFDHTSTLLFLEKRFGVQEPNISAYRRAICGDLTTAFNFANPNGEALPTLGGSTTKEAAAELVAQQESASAIPVPADPALPHQETGTRPSRALPYELHTTARPDASKGTVTLAFANSGQAGAVFHVYDKLHLSQIPRRYMVEAGKELDDTIDVNVDNGRYHLWILGPNGYHREFIGDLRDTATSGLEIQVCYQSCEPAEVQVKLFNRSSSAVTFSVTAQGYRQDGPWTSLVEAGKIGELSWALGDSGNWYDFVVNAGDSKVWSRRFAGRVENGKDSVSDPEMGQG